MFNFSFLLATLLFISPFIKDEVFGAVQAYIAGGPSSGDIFVISYPTRASASVNSYSASLTNTITPQNSNAGPVSVVTSRDGLKAYVGVAVPNGLGSSYINIIDTASNSISNTISIARPQGSVTNPFPVGIAVVVYNVGGTNIPYMYVVDQNNNCVYLISTLMTGTFTPTSSNTINVGSAPSSIAVAPTGNVFYVTNSLSNTVTVIKNDNTTLQTTKYDLNNSSFGFNGPSASLISQDGKFLYVTNSGGNTLSVIDTSKVLTASSINDSLYAIGSINLNNVILNVIDTTTNPVTQTQIQTGIGPNALVCSPNGRYLYITNQGTNSGPVTISSSSSISIVDTNPIIAKNINVAQSTIVSLINGSVDYPQYNTYGLGSNGNAVGVNALSSPVSIAITKDGSFLYVVNYSSNQVAVIYSTGKAFQANTVNTGAVNAYAVAISSPITSHAALAGATATSTTVVTQQGPPLVAK